MLDKTIHQSNQTTTDSNISPSQFWEDLRIVTQPYWYPTELGGRSFSEVITSWAMVLLLIALIIALVAVDGLGSFWNRYVLDLIIEERDLSKYYDTLWISCVIIVTMTLLIGFSKFIRKKLSLDWYKWLSNYILKRYLSNRAYYQLDCKSDLSNPDQRLAQEIEPITSGGFRLIATVLEKVLQMTTFIIILSTISQQIAIYLVIYTIVGNLIAIYLTQKLNKINNEALSFKADYNYCLTHVRNHSESIAFFQGEDQELNIIKRRFNKVLNNSEGRIDWERGQDIFNRVYQSAISIFSMFILTPLFIQDKIDYGEISQASMACLMFSNAVGILIAEWGTSGKLSSYIQRLANFSKMLKSIIKKSEELSTITIIEGNRLAFENVTLQTPNYDKIIVEDLSLSVQPGQGLLIVGPSGRGKSSLLRAIAGLWDAGTGRLVRPSLDKMIFLPQRPYIILGTLREQLVYPKIYNKISDEDLKTILKRVNLEHLLNRIDNFDVELPWENVLSLGEQQRLAFARILVDRPDFTILDEATSALDLSNEENLYQQLQQTKTTFISVGHRESLFSYHQWVLELLEDSSWQMLSMEEYKKIKLNHINPFQDNEIEAELIETKKSQPQLNFLEDITIIQPDNTPDLEDIKIEDTVNNEETSEDTKTLEENPFKPLSHTQMKALCKYALGTVRNKARKGQSIIGKDGLTYRYDQHPNVRKWVRELSHLT
ncbi:ABC transporter ATP-binding protein/permease [Crocosphaera sp. XPORK-15E]|uniref:ABC transporter ATP-binding protein/permease n=1 Tax=Crocosphaera sp. XPORK-15E TaxID=3110247 RepID=UPI002B20B54B|nr:ATP-binding cassette domain-containing protein [Crocosphaera sp. XPORK-15E]MEA5536924.1 ATP-binding cassette domain-containing protein [Crocosphaera sp. XPORK-15E]